VSRYSRVQASCVVHELSRGQTLREVRGDAGRSGAVAGLHARGAPARSGGDMSRAAVARQVRASNVGVSGGIASKSRCKASPPVSLTVCASPVHQSSRTLGPPMITSWWGQEVQASAFNAIRRTTPSRPATAVARAGSSVAGSRVRGHHPPFTTSSAVDEGESASRTPSCVAVTPGGGMPCR
jgi:hypothetical protein